MLERDVEVAFGKGDSVQVSSQSFFFHSTHHLAGLVVWMTLEELSLFKSVSSLLCTMLDGEHFVDVSSTWQMWNHQRSLSVLFWMFLDLGTSIGLGKTSVNGRHRANHSPWKRFAPNSICLPALHSTANFLMWDFGKTQEIPLRLCQSIARRARVDAKACFLTWFLRCLDFGKAFCLAFLCKAEPAVQPAQLFCSRRELSYHSE